INSVNITAKATSGNGGNIQIIAGSTSGTAILVERVTTTPGSLNGVNGKPGSVVMANAIPTGSVRITPGAGPTGGAIKGSFKPGALQAGGITSESVATGGGSLTISSSGAVLLDQPVTGGATVVFTNTNAVNPGQSAGNLTVIGSSIGFGSIGTDLIAAKGAD